MSNVLLTKYGNARLDNNGYYRITSKKEGNALKFLHRLIFEEHHKVTILPGNVVHHLDENPQNNSIENLKLMSSKEHTKLHHQTKLDDKTKLNMSKSRNTSGYFRVHVEKCSKCEQGFYYKYRYYENGKRKALSSVDIELLENKVKSKGLMWKKLTED